MQLLNHDISEILIEPLQEVGKAFFDLPVEEKEKYVNDNEAGKIAGYGSKLSNNASSQRDWEDYHFHLFWSKNHRDMTAWFKHAQEYMYVYTYSNSFCGFLSSNAYVINPCICVYIIAAK